MSEKRYRNTLSLAEKQKILDAAKTFKGTKMDLAKHLGLPVSTLSTILKKRDIIEENASKFGSEAKRRRALKTSPYDKIETVLSEWFKQINSQNQAVNGPVIREKALEIARGLGVENFSASNGWMDRFKKRHSLGHHSAHAESKRSEGDASLAGLASDYPPRNVFMLDETGLYFGLMPDITYAVKDESYQDGENAKLRLTVLLCCNSDGSEKLQPLVVGRVDGPSCFRNVKTLPTLYESNSSSWMTRDVFEKYVRYLDSRMKRRNRKIILFLDECSAHCDVVLDNVKLQFLPKNESGRVRPMDYGITRSFKSKYRYRLIKRALIEYEASKIQNVMDYKIDILEAMKMVSSAWNSVSTSCVKYCFSRAGISGCKSKERSLENDELSYATQGMTEVLNSLYLSPTEVEDYIDCDWNLVTCSASSIEYILPTVECESGETEEETSHLPVPSLYEAIQGLRTIQSFVASHENQEGLLCDIEKMETALLRFHKSGEVKVGYLEECKRGDWTANSTGICLPPACAPPFF